MSHHYPGPDYTFPNGDARLNFTDLYVFPKPGDDSKSILIMDVHPSFGFNPEGPTTTEPFATDALYELMIDTNGDAIPDIAYSVRFAGGNGTDQTATLRRINGTRTNRTADDGSVIVADAPVTTEREPHITNAGGYRFFAGWRSDPFFFDPIGALNNFQFSGQDFFGDKDVCSIVLEVPNSEFGSDNLGLWARTLDGSSGSWVQADRGALASQEPFLAGDKKAEYLSCTEPAKDMQFIPVFAHSLEHTGGYAPEEATRVAATLLPDILPYHPSRKASYPTNGRNLTDDAGAHFLTILSNGKVTGDNLRPHTDLLTVFPFVGPPHKA